MGINKSCQVVETMQDRSKQKLSRSKILREETIRPFRYELQRSGICSLGDNSGIGAANTLHQTITN
jgi:hypothetical protein